ncbi:MAG: hypothetical protein P4L10_08985 [Acidobacteriaceae bacterium]|nr:hypothetical protein [Acidobacteriaceae bacterium]
MKLELRAFVVEENVVQTQWTHSLNLVNAPTPVKLLNPGQCVRLGVLAIGDGRDELLQKATVQGEIKFAGKTSGISLASLAPTKQLKPEGGDFVTGALAAGGIKNPMLTMASMGVSPGHWCVPNDAADGTAAIAIEVETPAGHQKLDSATVQIESFKTGAETPFTSTDAVFSDFLQTYYRQPNSARLLPALRFIVAEEEKKPGSGGVEIFAAFLTAALKADPVAAKDFMVRIVAEPQLERAIGLLALQAAGYDLSSALGKLDADQQAKFKELPHLDDPFDLTVTQTLASHMDLMWGVFGATGQLEPVQTIASALRWRPEYDDFQAMVKAGKVPKEVTPALMRGVVYTAAGWSLSLFQLHDPLVADYIEYLIAQPDTPQAVKVELAGLGRNPAFRKQ